RLLGVAERVTSHGETTACRVQAKIARAQAGMAQWEAISGREQTRLDLLEANRARIEARLNAVRDRMGFVRARVATAQFNPVATVPTICPRVRVNVPQIHVAVPSVNVQPQVVVVQTQDSDPI